MHTHTRASVSVCALERTAQPVLMSTDQESPRGRTEHAQHDVSVLEHDAPVLVHDAHVLEHDAPLMGHDAPVLKRTNAVLAHPVAALHQLQRCSEQARTHAACAQATNQAVQLSREKAAIKN